MLPAVTVTFIVLLSLLSTSFISICFMFSLFTYLLSIDSRIEVVIVSSSLLVSFSLFTYIVSKVSRSEIVKNVRY